jgi:hypothetical protein
MTRDRGWLSWGDQRRAHRRRCHGSRTLGRHHLGPGSPRRIPRLAMRTPPPEHRDPRRRQRHPMVPTRGNSIARGMSLTMKKGDMCSSAPIACSRRAAQRIDAQLSQPGAVEHRSKRDATTPDGNAPRASDAGPRQLQHLVGRRAASLHWAMAAATHGATRSRTAASPSRTVSSSRTGKVERFTRASHTYR